MSLHHYSERVFAIADFLSFSECQALIELAESQGFASAAVRTQQGPQMLSNIRNNQRTILPAPTWIAQLWARLQSYSLPLLDGMQACALPRELRFYKYEPGQRFKMHKDGPWHEDGLSSKLTFLLYLNDDFTGGMTDFRDFSVTPQRGQALLFVHDTWHEGQAVQTGVKYVLRSDVMYR